MRYTKPLTLTALALFMSAGLLTQSAMAQSQSGQELVIENFIGTIKWSNASDIIQVLKQDNVKGLSLYEGESFIIDGGIEKPNGNKCEGYYGSYDLNFFKKKSQGNFGGYEDLNEYPTLSLSLPNNTQLVVRNAIVFTEGEPDMASANLQLKSCGKVNLGNVSGDVRLESEGAADLTLLDAGSIHSEVSGSSDIKAKKVGYLQSEGRGSGDITIEEVTTLNVEISGSGDLEVETLLGSADIESSGSGDVDIANISGELDYEGAGSGDLSIDEIGVEGPRDASLKSAGSGDIDINDGTIAYLTINVSGSSNADIDAIVEDVVAGASGSSDIYIDTVTGSAEQKSSGSSDIKIDNRN